MPAPSIIARPKPTYWLSYFLVMPIGGFIFFAMIGGGICQIMGSKLNRPELLTGWAITTVLLTLFALNIDRRKPHCELTDTTLRIGRGSNATEIHLTEIESVVHGLPAHTPWWFRMLGIAPKSQAAHRFITIARANTLFIRFSNHRCVPLFLLYSWMHNGPEIMIALHERLRDKFVGQDSYTAAEVKALGVTAFNRVQTLRG